MLNSLFKKLLFWKSSIEKSWDFDAIDPYKKQALVIVIAQELENQSKINSQKIVKSTVVRITCYDAIGFIKISLQDYLSRISYYVGALPCELVTMMIYLNNYFQRNKDVVMTESNMHRFVLVSFLLAHKTIRIKPVDDAHIAELGGIDSRELQALELKFLQDNDFHFLVKSRDYRMCEQRFGKLSEEYIAKNPELITSNQTSFQAVKKYNQK
jgi:hypothetical protein